MSLDADLIVDRRRMRRKLTFWRVRRHRGDRPRRSPEWPRLEQPRGFAGAGAYIARVTIRD